MSVVIKCVDLAGMVVAGERRAPSGAYLQSFNPEAYDGRGYANWTMNVERAMKFETAAEAFAFWRQESVTRPLREDGLPNRPLTAFTIEVLYAE